MRGYLDPPEEPDLPMCCGEFMEYSYEDDNCRCVDCGKVIEPEPDIEPDPFFYDEYNNENR